MAGNPMKLSLALVFVYIVGQAFAQGQPVPAIRLVDASAPSEVTACIRGTVPDESQSAFEDAVDEADKRLMDEARRLRVTRIGESYINSIDQVQGDSPPNFELCRAVGERPAGTTDLTFYELPVRAVRVGYCSSTDADRCREALKGALTPAPVAGNQAASPPFAVTRVASWNGPAPPSSTSQMLDAVIRLSPVTVESQTGGDGQAGGAVEVRDDEPRPIGDPRGARAPVSGRMEAPAHRPAIGFVFAVSK